MEKSRLPSSGGIRETLGHIRPCMPVSPVVRAEMLSDLLGVALFLKIEPTSPVRSFKIRGALNSVLANGADACVDAWSLRRMIDTPPVVTRK